MAITTLGELLHWSYANLAMAHSAVTAKEVKYGARHFRIRSRLYAGLNSQKQRQEEFAKPGSSERVAIRNANPRPFGTIDR